MIYTKKILRNFIFEIIGLKFFNLDSEFTIIFCAALNLLGIQENYYLNFKIIELFG